MSNSSIFNIPDGEVPNDKVIEIMKEIPTESHQAESLLEIFLQPIKERGFSCKCSSKSAVLTNASQLEKNIRYSSNDFALSLNVANTYNDRSEHEQTTLNFDCYFIPNKTVSKEPCETINLKEYVIKFEILTIGFNTLFLRPEDFRIYVSNENVKNDYGYIYGYSFKIDEQGNLCVEVFQNAKVIGTINYSEFIDLLKNKQYEKLINYKFTTFQPNNKKGKY